MNRGGARGGKGKLLSFTCVALIGFIRFINNGGIAKSIASRSMGKRTVRTSGMSEGPEKKARLFGHTQGSCVVPRCQSQSTGASWLEPRAALDDALSNVYHTSFGVPVMMDSVWNYYVLYRSPVWVGALLVHAVH
jgi:hypothetical protein